MERQEGEGALGAAQDSVAGGVIQPNMQAAMSAIVTKLTDEQVASFAIAAPTTPTEDVFRRLLEHGLSRGGRPRKTGRAAQPVSGPVTLAELDFKKGFLTRCQKLAAIPAPDRLSA